MLRTSYQNVRRLQRTGQLHSSPDRYGVHRFDRREVETLAKKRGLQIKPTGELVAKVFAMFEQRRRFAEIVIETQQEPDVIRLLWSDYTAGFREAADMSRRLSIPKERTKRPCVKSMKSSRVGEPPSEARVSLFPRRVLTRATKS